MAANHEIDALKALLDRFRLEVNTLRADTGAENIKIGNYLLKRLEQLNVLVGGHCKILYHLLIAPFLVHVWSPWRF